MAARKLLEAKNITKRFGGVLALDDVTLELGEREVLALVGDNGAGKSTLIKILSGTLLADSGQIFVDGQRQYFRSPADAKKSGIETVFQDLALVETLNVSNNVFLGREEVRPLFWGTVNFLKHRRMEEESKRILGELGICLPDLKAQVNLLSGGQRQCIAVGRAAAFGRRIVLLDEPTAALGVHEAKMVLSIIKKLKDHDISAVIITHNLEHAFAVADRFFVLRLGREVGTKQKADTHIDDIVKMITGGTFVEAGPVKVSGEGSEE
jgi:fructose transport system ATP-binding protein